MTVNEDRSQVRTGAGQQAMATLRNTAISLHRLAGSTTSPPACDITPPTENDPSPWT